MSEEQGGPQAAEPQMLAGNPGPKVAESVRVIDERELEKGPNLAKLQEQHEALRAQRTEQSPPELQTADRAVSEAVANLFQIPGISTERPKTVEVNLEDGRTVLIGRPSAATQLLVAQMLGSQLSLNQLLLSYAKAMMHVKEIDGEQVHRPTDMVTLQSLMNKLGEQGCDVVLAAVGFYFPPYTEADLLMAKKNK